MIQFAVGDEVARWVAARVDGVDFADLGPHQAIGVLKNGSPVVGVIYNNFRRLPHGADIFVTIRGETSRTGRRWAHRPILHRLFSYPFEELGCARISALIREGNAPSEKLCRNLGFRREGVARRGFDGRTNGLLYGLLKSECVWLGDDGAGIDNGKRRRVSSILPGSK